MPAHLMRVLVAAASVASYGSCDSAKGAVTPARYGAVEGLYRHMETTGIMDSLTLTGGGFTTIEFSADSSSDKLSALRHLVDRCNDGDTSFIFGTTPPDFGRRGGERFRQLIHIRGKLDSVVRKDLDGEPFQRFVLEDWYVETPVEVAVSTAPDVVQKRVVHDAKEARCPPLVHEGRAVDMNPFFRAAW